MSFDSKFPTNKLLWKSILGKKNNPDTRPQKIDVEAKIELILLLKKP